MKRPAEIAGIAGAIALLISHVVGVNDSATITAIGTVVGFIPAAVTWIVVTIKGDSEVKK